MENNILYQMIYILFWRIWQWFPNYQYQSWSRNDFFSNRRACNGRLTIGRSKEGLPLVGFKYRKADDWLYLNSKQEGVRLVGFKYQKGYDCLNSQFHCSYLESRGVPGKTREIISLSFPVTSFPVMQLPVTSCPVMQLPVMQLPAPPQIISGWCFYTTKICGCTTIPTAMLLWMRPLISVTYFCKRPLIQADVHAVVFMK